MTTGPAPVSPARARIAALGSPWDDGGGARTVSAVFDHAELVAEVSRAGAELTAARTRRLQHGNADRAADDPQFRRVIGEASARAAVAAAAADSLLRAAEEGSASVDDAELLLIGLAALARESLRTLFDTLGASSTLEHHGLHLLWARLHELEARDRVAARAPFSTPGREIPENAPRNGIH